MDLRLEKELHRKYTTYPIGRRLETVYLFSCNLDERQLEGVSFHALDHNSFVSGGIITSSDGDAKLSTFFPDMKTDTHIARYVPSNQITATGFGCRLQLKNWEAVRYFAIGFNVSGTYYHVKIAHPTLEKETVLFFSLSDLIYLIQNNWQNQDDVQITDVKFFIKGTGGYGGGEFELYELCIFKEYRQDFNLNIKGENICFTKIINDWKVNFTISRQLQEIIFGYQSAVYPAAEEHVNSFMAGRGVGISKNMAIGWNIFDHVPERLNESITYRYAWHSFYPVCILLKKANQTGAVNYICAARDFINNWLDANLFSPTKDIKYAWYDHGTAERLIVLVQMWFLGVKHQFDARFMGRLLYTIYLHAQLMASAAFYASHQNYKYHNHAIFQDLALLFVSLAIPEFTASNYWFSLAVERLRDQLDHLIVSDNEFAVFVENSTGYHNGVLTIVGLVTRLLQYAEIQDERIHLYEKMKNFTEMIRYPGSNRMPSTGDTFRKANSIDAKKTVKKVNTQKFFLLKKAGYAVAKGVHNEIPFQFTMLATSLSKTHKHCDNLSFTLFFDGIEWLIDPSFYSHQYNDVLPNYLRGPSAHNALIVEGLDYSIEPGLAEIFTTRNIEQNKFEVYGVHRSYGEVQVNRFVIGMFNSLYIQFVDKVSTAINDKKIYLLLHCGEQVNASVSGNKLTLTSELSEYALCIQLPSDKCDVFQGVNNNDLVCGWAGAGFQEAAPISTVRCEVKSNQELEWNITVVENELM